MLTRKVSKESRVKKGGKEQSYDDEGYDISINGTSSFTESASLPNDLIENLDDETNALDDIELKKPASKKKK